MITKGEWKAEWDFLGGYDCMSHAYKIISGEQKIAVLDCAYYKGSPQLLSMDNKTEGTTTTPEIRANANIIVTAVNVCQEINPDNPQAAAEAITDMYEALKEAFDSLATDYPNSPLAIKVGHAIMKAEGGRE